MAYNRINKLKLYKKIVVLTNEYYDPEVTTYAKVWRKYVYGIYPISYSHYMKIINTGNIDKLLEEEEKKHGRWEDPAQTRLL